MTSKIVGVSIQNILDDLPKKSNIYKSMNNKINKPHFTAQNLVSQNVQNKVPNLQNQHYDIDNFNNQFMKYCESGEIDKIKCLYKDAIINGILVDIHYGNDIGFRLACYYGHIDIVCWLYNIAKELNTPIDITQQNNVCFKYACINEHYYVAKWLAKLCPKYIVKLHYEILK